MTQQAATMSRKHVSIDVTEDARAAQIESFRVWLKDVLAHNPQSIHGIEVTAGIRGNALGKFLRGERGARHSLTPLMIRRLAPVLGLTEETILAKAGHMSHAPGLVSIESAILADPTLSYEDKQFLMETYRRAIKK